MALHEEPASSEVYSPRPADYEQKVAALRAAIAEGEASPDAEGDIFAVVAERLGLDLHDEV